MAICPTGVGIPRYPWQHTHACTVTNRVLRREIQVVAVIIIIIVIISAH